MKEIAKQRRRVISKTLIKKINDMFDVNGLSSEELYGFLLNNEEDDKNWELKI